VETIVPRLTTGSVGRHLKALALPMAVGFVALNSYSIADTYFVGQLGTLQLAAIGFTFPVAFTMVAIGLGVGIATSSVLARLLGTGDRDAVQRITTHALLLGALLGVALLVIGLATIEPVFLALGADERTLPLIRDYMRPYYFGSVLFVLPMVGNFSLRAMGDSKVPAVILSLSAIVNIVLDPLLIFGLWGFPRLELQGAAIATVLANAVTVVASLTILYRRERMIRWRYVNVDDLWDSWRRLLHIAIPATATNLLLPVTFAAITAMVAVYGPEAVAGFAVASRLESVVLIVIFAVQASVGPVVGQNYGVGLLGRVRDAISLSNRFLLIYSLVFAVILFMFARPMAELFDENPVVVETATAYLRIVPFTYGAFGVMMISLGGFNSLGRPMPPAILTFVKFVIIYLPLAWVLTRSIGITGIFWANAVSHVLLGIASAIWLRKALVSLEAEDRLTRPLASVNVAPTPESSS
jgi:putative MATE family efflux protein